MIGKYMHIVVPPRDSQVCIIYYCKTVIWKRTAVRLAIVCNVQQHLLWVQPSREEHS